MDDNLDIWAKVLAEKIVDAVLQNLKDQKVKNPIESTILAEQKRLQFSKFYFAKHTWAKVEPNWNVKIGLTDYALRSFKGLAKLYTEKVGAVVRRLEPFGFAETWMYLFDLYTPIAGTLVAANDAVLHNPAVINSETWLIEVKPLNYNALIKELEALMDEKQYLEYTSQLEDRILSLSTG